MRASVRAVFVCCCEHGRTQIWGEAVVDVARDGRLVDSEHLERGLKKEHALGRVNPICISLYIFVSLIIFPRQLFLQILALTASHTHSARRPAAAALLVLS